MRKMKKIITLAMTLVMMMAMSITAFADEEIQTIAGPNVKVTNISNREGKDADGKDVVTDVKIYKLATVDAKKNTVIVEEWAEKVYTSDLPNEFDASTLSTQLAVADRAGKATLVDEKTSVAGADVEFTNLPAGAYVVKVTGSKVAYNLMVAVTYDVDDDGNYIAKKSESEDANFITIKAKGTTNKVDKVADDKFVKAGDVVPFTITTTVPYNKDEFKVFDSQLNLTAPTEVTVTVADETKSFTFDAGVADTDNQGYTKYTMDLSSLVKKDGKKINDYAGATVVITYKATVVGADGFVNLAWDSTDGEKAEEIGFTAKLVVTKLDENEEAIKDNPATFEVYEVDAQGNLAQNPLTFTLTNGVYVLDSSSNTAAVKTANDGTVAVAGLEEGTYAFKETVAPDGYSINVSPVLFEVEETDTPEEGRVVVYEDSIKDSTLIQLPFTGGMGTTIFTILGVAIMAMAAALFFATKKSR